MCSSSSLIITPSGGGPAFRTIGIGIPKCTERLEEVGVDDVKAIWPRNNAEWFYEMASSASIPLSLSLSLAHTHYPMAHFDSLATALQRLLTQRATVRSVAAASLPPHAPQPSPFDVGSRPLRRQQRTGGEGGRTWVLPAVSGHQRRQSCHTATGRTLFDGRKGNGFHRSP
uniref:Uncharacterized protein n=1 Tax=Anopheles darlingi TaxID=43151 RepID=A0A2M4CK63_ANODA